MASFFTRDEALSWLRQFQCQSDEPYTHSSMRGTRDWATKSGKLCIPDTEEAQRQLFDAISLSYSEWWSPLCFVEMCTHHRPFIEDIDILGTSIWDDQPPDDLILGSNFFQLRAKELYRLCPQITSLELTLFTASGWHRDKECHKSSFHAVWRELVVTENLARILRSETVAAFERLSEDEPLKSLQRKLLQLSPNNRWDMVFDITSVRAGSFRMPFCDKFTRGIREKREVRPVGVYKFEFGEPIEGGADNVKEVLMFGPNDLSNTEWLARGSVRRPHDPPPPLVKLAPHIDLRLNCPADEPRQAAHSSLPTLAQEVIDTKEGNSRWMRPAPEFREELNRQCGDHRGEESTWEALPSKPGEQRWQWKSKSKHLKGCVELHLPSGKIIVKGAETQKARLLLLIEKIAGPWAIIDTRPREQSAGSQAGHEAAVSECRASIIPGDALEPMNRAVDIEQGYDYNQFLTNLCSNPWQSDNLGAVWCRRGRGQRPMVDVFPVDAAEDAERVGSIIILGSTVSLILMSDSAQLQLQGHGLGKHLLWHCVSSLEDLWKMQAPVMSGTSARLLPLPSGPPSFDQVGEGGLDTDSSPKVGVESQDEPDPEYEAGASAGHWCLVHRRHRPRNHALDLAEMKDRTTIKSHQQKNFNRRARRREARDSEAREAEIKNMDVSKAGLLLPSSLPTSPPSPWLPSVPLSHGEAWAEEAQAGQLEPVTRASRWERRAVH